MSSSITRGVAIAATAAIAVATAVVVPSGLGQTPDRPPTAEPPSSRVPMPSDVTHAGYWMTGDDVRVGFAYLISMTTEVESTEYMEAGQKGPEFGRTVGRLKPPVVTLRRPMTYGLGLAQWHAVVRQGGAGRLKTLTLALVAGTGGKTVARWKLFNAWPMKVEIETVRDVLTETVTFAADELIRESPS